MTATDRVILRYGRVPGGSLTFQDCDGTFRTVRGGEEFEVDRTTAEILVRDDPADVVAVPRDLIALREHRSDLTRPEVDRLYRLARQRLESLGETASAEAIAAELDQLAPPPEGHATSSEPRSVEHARSHVPLARSGRPRGSTTTIRNDDDYRGRWALYGAHCAEVGVPPTLSGFSTWTGTDVPSGSFWPPSTIKDYRRSARDRGVQLPPA